jgi:hypothetical protein
MSPVSAKQYDYYDTFHLGDVIEFNSKNWSNAYNYGDKCVAFQSCAMLKLIGFSDKGTVFNRFEAVRTGSQVVKMDLPFWLDPNYYHFTVLA